MLTLTRKIGQKILIGDGIEIVVREIRGRQVRLGITAPGGLPVYREELFAQLVEENRRASQATALAEIEFATARIESPPLASASSSSTPSE